MVGTSTRRSRWPTKSAQVDAVLRTGALSDVFTQDLDDAPGGRSPRLRSPTPCIRLPSCASVSGPRGKALAPEAKTREAVEALIKERTGMDLHPDFYEAILARLEGRP